MIKLSSLTNQSQFKKAVMLVSLATLLGVACSLPDLICYVHYGKNYEPFTHNFSSDTQFDETSWYAPSANYFKETHRFPFEAEIYEYRNLVNPKYLLPIIIDGSTALLFGDLRNGRMFSHFLFPFLCFLLVFCVAQNASKNFFVALFSSLLFCVFALGPRRFLNLSEYNLNQPLLIARVTSPAATLPILLLALSSLQKICEGKNSYRTAAQAALFCGLTFFTYYYYQLAVCVTLFFLWIFALFTNKKYASVILRVSVGAFIVGLPWVFQLAITLKQNPVFFEIHQAPAGAMVIRIKMLVTFFLIWALFLGVLLDINKNLIKKYESGIWSAFTPLYFLWFSGISLRYFPPFDIIQSAHFTTHIIWPFFILLLTCFLFGQFITRRPKYGKVATLFFLVTLILLMFSKQWRMAEHTRNHFVADATERVAENLIQEKTSKTDVIAMADIYLNSVIAARIWRFKFYAGYYGMSNVPIKENVERYLFVQKLFGRSWGEILEQIKNSNNFFIATPRLLTLQREFSSEEIERYKKHFDEMDMNFLSNKKMDFILCLDSGQKQRVESQAAKFHLPILMVAEKKGVSLFKMAAAPKM